MPIISKIDRKTPKTRLLIDAIYLVLIVGSITMLYPFALMLAGSTKSAVDLPNNVVIPKFLVSEQALYQKHIEGLFNESLEQMLMAYDSPATSFMTLEMPAEAYPKLVAEWRSFLEEEQPPFYTNAVGYIRAPVSRGVLPSALREFKAQLIERYDDDIEAMNRELGTEFVNWNAFWVLPEDYTLRRNKPGSGPFDLAFREFKQTVPVEDRTYFCIEGFYKNSFLKSQYTDDIEAYNAEHETDCSDWSEVHLTRRLPTDGDKTREDWETFVRTILNLLWIRADAEAEPYYQRFLEGKYRSIKGLNNHYETDYASFGDIKIFAEPPTEGLALSDWDAFLQGWKDPDTGEQHMLPTEMMRVHSLDFMFRDFVKDKYGTIAKANAQLGTDMTDWLGILPPQAGWHCEAFKANIKPLRREFVRRNYVTVADYIVRHGRGILNTVIYCALAILSALIVNPLAAYALSRYRPPWSYKVLLFLMLTMAFPPMVTQIPVFLMLRQFSLLNTFWALVLPGLANGYMIFLLKGFFDSLPQELYESAALDGAGEFRIFWQITVRLSQPILAVIALQAFTAAYSNFMMALLICQDERMWTLMPWLYQLQQRSGQGVVFASLLIAAIPTFLVFAFCQNIIMRGIVVPVEK